MALSPALLAWLTSLLICEAFYAVVIKGTKGFTVLIPTLLAIIALVGWNIAYAQIINRGHRISTMMSLLSATAPAISLLVGVLYHKEVVSPAAMACIVVSISFGIVANLL